MSPVLGTFAAASVRGFRVIGGPGQVAYTTPGTYTFVVPDGVSSLIVLAVGAGEGGLSNGVVAGDGGSLSYDNALSVTPGEALTVVVGAGGAGVQTGSQNPGGDSTISRGGTAILRAKGGGSGSSNVGGVSYTGGAGSHGGGGAAGYSGNGGGGGALNTDGSAGSGGGGGGGGGGNTSGGNTFGGGGGGGVGILGEGSSGAGGGRSGTIGLGGKGGSGGDDGADQVVVPVGNPLSVRIAGGAYGGGGAAAGTTFGASGNGAGGAVRVLWGGGRSFPSNAGNL
jgi:hypothetical protein